MKIILQGTYNLHFKPHTLCFDVTHKIPALQGQWTLLIAFNLFQGDLFILHFNLEKPFHGTRTHLQSLVLMPRRTGQTWQVLWSLLAPGVVSFIQRPWQSSSTFCALTVFFKCYRCLKKCFYFLWSSASMQGLTYTMLTERHWIKWLLLEFPHFIKQYSSYDATNNSL